MSSDKAAKRAIEQVERHLETGRAQQSRILDVVFAVANTPRDIQHGLGVTPDGYEIVFADAEVHASPGLLWTPTLAFLQANADNARIKVRFYVTREGSTNA